jgi:hypothetical protein
MAILKWLWEKFVNLFKAAFLTPLGYICWFFVANVALLYPCSQFGAICAFWISIAGLVLSIIAYYTKK